MVPSDSLELWGGLECTIARVGDEYRDQVGLTGHHDRPADLDLVAGLGIRTLRYPVLWEALSDDVPSRGWHWHDARLRRLRELGIRPIIGLLHHGSGPRDTSLLDPAFARRLAGHAGQVARRYPWVTDYTPVNEPLTTARFSALYGFWYPHRRSYPDFLRALVNQCRGIVLAMEAVREINPAARLVQTEDLGRVFSSPALAYQADHENERRWLTFDLLFGRLDPQHPWWRIFRENGVGADELESFVMARPPDIVGINHYLTSDRYLDDDQAAYPTQLWGDNGRHRYADAEAVRCPGLEGRTGLAARLREVAARYAAPVAVTEVHHGCTREEQLRWLAEAWHDAQAARSEGLDVRAVTLWSLFGACDWNSLLTRPDGIYEPGAFDMRGLTPRPTALAAAAAALARGGSVDHPVAVSPGWWHRSDRYYRYALRGELPRAASSPTIAIVGVAGPLRDESCRIASQRGLAFEVVPPSERIDPMHGTWAVVDLDGETSSADTELRASRLSYAAAAKMSYLLLQRTATSSLSDEPAADRNALASRHHPGALVVRHGTLFGPGVPPGGQPVCPGAAPGPFSYVPDLLHVAFDLLIDGECGTWHLVNPSSPAGTARSEDGAGVRLMPPLASALARFALAPAVFEEWTDIRLAAAE